MSINQKLIAAIFGVGTIVAFLFVTTSKQSAPLPAKPINHIVAFGDSLTVGVGAGEQGGWTPTAEGLIGKSIVRIARSGVTTSGALPMVDEVRAQKPDMVIVFLGGNDALQRLPPEATFDNLRTIVRELKSDGIFVVLVGVRGGFFSDRYRKSFEDLAKSEQTPLVPNVLDDIFGDPKLMSEDSIHPNENGYRIIGERIGQAMRAYIR
jgi:acyl-CoA thioesterase-1